MSSRPGLHEDAPGWDHLEICLGPDGQINFFPKGEPARIEMALTQIVMLFTEHPERVACAAGSCKGKRGHVH